MGTGVAPPQGLALSAQAIRPRFIVGSFPGPKCPRGGEHHRGVAWRGEIIQVQAVIVARGRGPPPPCSLSKTTTILSRYGNSRG